MNMSGDLENGHNGTQMELEKETDSSIGIGERTCLLFKPFRNLIVDRENKTLSVTIVPESFRTYFYISFYLFVLLAITITMGSRNEAERDEILEDNLIKKLFGANNICIFWDDPPFSYMAAFFFLPTITILLIYLVFDAIRVYFNYTTGHFSKTFYKIYVGFSLFTGLGISFFIQSFATQPEQCMYIYVYVFNNKYIYLYIQICQCMQDHFYFLHMDYGQWHFVIFYIF